ncbi:inositol hexakisphosphate kinase 3-like isoform X2 [Ostrea edulis]|nr:inositol hexakisphosphate kinase 3-like isoform X2 [Ostrea edulis]XP_048731732.1 inositol hexakisphosphate kinase 3-like isoform X2 [Ostrea edulis]XP_048731733.1 inositol hexakisphosphate kinase 3-like isoform X2 [Ostrea edulis]XP_048731734.1 inositol hexakisphosphate kinase 3-like isoform X2 [Ostrea edulis]XP_048731735.1 inositol hexakisphosphate kinase 3-like isoform X2 [Ostrea edulis]XP_056007075.1 inositol hexakisphosphate kinase 3-like isoform X2 [Ostrea edulis]
MPEIEQMGESDLDIVTVTPFVHQVGGHTCVLQVTPNVVCKPYQENEVMFYRKLPEGLQGFVPFYRGVINIKCDSDNGNVTFQGEVPKGFMSTLQETNGDLPDKISLIKDNNSASEAENLRTWSDECIRRQIDRYGYWREGKVQQFIMLENLVAPYRYPSVMDLKMGTNHMSRDASETKKRMLEERWMSTTSASLGFRMCGIQVYKNDSKSYISHDKYFGRGLDKNGVRDEMMNFFHDGFSLRKDAITSIITKLRHMLVALDTQRAFKLFSCSLLILYEGDSTLARDVHNKPLLDIQTCINDVRLIDFANAIETSNCSNEDITSKAGIRFGIKSLISLLEEFL